jgi:mannose-6-phosphate isomerase
MANLGPLLLERKLDTRIWGGSTLGAWLEIEHPPEQLAESWQVYEHNHITNGPYAGQTLAEVVKQHGADMVGTRSFERYGADFPLLAKFIDAADNLSVQVHPDDEYAHRVEAATGFHGKTEAWYILKAEPGTDVIHGLSESSSREAFAASVSDGSLMNLLRRVPIHEGDTVFVPAGTVHAINAGTMLFEIQEKSDLTYRVYDYDRRDANGNLRELHLDRALDVINYSEGQQAKAEPQQLGNGRTLLVTCPYFSMERWDLTGEVEEQTDPTTFEILTIIDGVTQISWLDGVLRLKRGQSIVLPAALGSYQLQPMDSATLLRCFVP